jgi:DNA-binding transcriptional LysR family regulator
MGSEEAYQAIAQRQVELALTTLETQSNKDIPEGIISEVLWQDEMIFVCATDHPLNKLKQVKLRDLSEFPAILPENNTFTFKLLAEQFNQQDLILNTPMPTNYLETIKMLVSVGIGWSLLPASMVENNEESGLSTLAVSSNKGKIKLTRPLGLLYLQGRTLSNAAKAFITLIKA